MEPMLRHPNAYYTERETYHQEIQGYQHRLNDYAQEVIHYQEEITHLKEQLRLALAARYARSSEQYVAEGQLSLFDDEHLLECYAPESTVEEAPPEDIAIAEHTRKSSRGKRKPLPDYLPRERVIHTLSEAELIGENGEQFEVIGEVITEQLDIVPASVKVIQHVREQYAVKGREELGVKLAPLPERIIPKSIATAGLISHVATAKYHHHLPLYRQEQIWKSLDVHLPRNTLCRWILKAGEALTPLLEYLFADMCEHRHMQIDETPVNVLEKAKKQGEGKISGGYMWCYRNIHGVLYEYCPNRNGAHVQNRLQEYDYEGYAQCDGYSGYGGLSQTGKIELVGCMAHARRKFTDVNKACGKKRHHPVADYVIKQIARLYHMERQAKAADYTPEQIKEMRQSKAIPILDQLHAYVLEKKHQYPTKGVLGKAIGYLLNQWDKLYRYTADGIIHIDNNAAERAIRPFTIGRKNWLFHGNEKSAKASANWFSLIETAKIHDLKIFDYLKWVLQQLPTADTPRQREALLPRYAAKAHPEMLIKSP